MTDIHGSAPGFARPKALDRRRNQRAPTFRHQAETALPEDSRLAELDGFRGLSILAVLAAHMLPLGPQSWHLNATSGLMGMSIFFALSGFLITSVLWERRDVPVFFLRRLARIAPLAILVSAIYCLALEGRPDSFVAANLHVLNYWHSALNPSIGPFWSLAVEIHFYVAIGLAVLCFGRRGFWLVPVALLVVIAIRINTGDFSNIKTHLRMDEILAGAGLALLWLHRDRPGVALIFQGLKSLFWPLLMLWALSCWDHAAPLGYARGLAAAGLIGSVLAMQGRWQNVLLSTRALAYVATISFALYVLHSPFRLYWFDSGTDLERYLIKRPLAFACIFALAHLSTFHFEKPITDAVRRWTSGRRANHTG